MKKLCTIFIFCIANNISLHSMNIVSQQKLHKSIIKQAFNNKTKRSLSINDIKKNVLNINNFANFGNIIYASMTANPAYLLPIIPQTLQIISDSLYSSQEPTKFSQELTHLIGTDSETINNLQNLKQMHLLKKHIIHHKVSLDKNKIDNLEQELTRAKFTLIENTSPLLKRYSEAELSQYLQNYKKLLKLTNLHWLCAGTSLYNALITPAVVILMDPFNSSGTAGLILLSFIVSNGMLNINNLLISYSRANQAADGHYYKDFDHRYTLSPNDAIQILETYKTNTQTQNNKLNQTNE